MLDRALEPDDPREVLCARPARAAERRGEDVIHEVRVQVRADDVEVEHAVPRDDRAGDFRDVCHGGRSDYRDTG